VELDVANAVRITARPSKWLIVLIAGNIAKSNTNSQRVNGNPIHFKMTREWESVGFNNLAFTARSILQLPPFLSKQHI